MAAQAWLLGGHVRVGMEDSNWLYPHRDETCDDNGVAVSRAVDLANMLGRRPATGDDYRRILGLPPNSNA